MTSIQPELWVETPGEAVAFYEAAFGATVKGVKTRIPRRTEVLTPFTLEQRKREALEQLREVAGPRPGRACRRPSARSR